MEWLDKVPDLAEINKTIQKMKVSPLAISWVFVLAFSALVFLPDDLLAIIGLSKVRESAGHFPGVGLIIATSLLVVIICSKIVEELEEKWFQHKEIKSLSTDSLKVLRALNASTGKSGYLRLSTAVFTELANNRIIHWAKICDPQKDLVDTVCCYLQPWVVLYLRKHRNFTSKLPRGGKSFLEDD